jgi:hypothetical protein
MKLWNNKGFSLVSVMIAAGMLGGLSLAVMQVMKNIGDGQSRANSMADEAEMAISVRMVLDNPNYCRISLAGEDPAGSPVTFKKKDIDFAGVEVNRGSAFTEVSEGLDVDLWYSNVAGDSRTLKKFNGADSPGSDDKSKFGKLNITSMKLVMNNGLGGCSDNYCDGTDSDTGQLVIIYEKKINSSQRRKMKKIFNVNVGMSTDSSGESTILSCDREREVPSMKWESVGLSNTDKWQANCIYRVYLKPYKGFYYGEKLSSCTADGCKILSLGTTHYVGSPKPYLYPNIRHHIKSSLHYYEDFNTSYGSYEPSSGKLVANKVQTIDKLCAVY